MKGRESGMPEEAYWNTFFNPSGVLDQFGFPHNIDPTIVEFGSGYGTFTLPIAARTKGTVTALDIEATLIAQLSEHSSRAGFTHIQASERDFLEAGSGLADASQDAAFIFNLLHIETPLVLLLEAYRVLRPAGKVYVIHWRTDIETPRGPPLSIRPSPAQSETWCKAIGFNKVAHISFGASAPYHYGLIAHK